MNVSEIKSGTSEISYDRYQKSLNNRQANLSSTTWVNLKSKSHPLSLANRPINLNLIIHTNKARKK